MRTSSALLLLLAGIGMAGCAADVRESSPSGCSSNDDCKGDRICVGGVCQGAVNPTGARGRNETQGGDDEARQRNEDAGSPPDAGGLQGGGGSCSELFYCQVNCPPFPATLGLACRNNCIETGTESAVAAFDGISVCIDEKCPPGSSDTCKTDECFDAYRACFEGDFDCFDILQCRIDCGDDLACKAVCVLKAGTFETLEAYRLVMKCLAQACPPGTEYECVASARVPPDGACVAQWQVCQEN